MHRIATKRKISCLGPSDVPSALVSSQMLSTPSAESTPIATSTGQLAPSARRCQSLFVPRTGAMTARVCGERKLINISNQRHPESVSKNATSVILRYSEGSSRVVASARSFGVPQDDKGTSSYSSATIARERFVGSERNTNSSPLLTSPAVFGKNVESTRWFPESPSVNCMTRERGAIGD